MNEVHQQELDRALPHLGIFVNILFLLFLVFFPVNSGATGSTQPHFFHDLLLTISQSGANVLKLKKGFIYINHRNCLEFVL